MSRIKVAIIGGGLAGVILLRSLLKLDHLEVKIYESRPQFKEEGAAIGLAINAQNSMRAIDPELEACLDRAGAVEEKFIIYGAGSDSMKPVYIHQADADKTVKSVARAPFLNELLSGIPPSILHSNKRVIDIHTTDDGQYVVHFQDGTKETFDVIFGADGIHSSIRKHVLGEESPFSKPVGAGWWHLFVLVPLDEAREIMGDLADPEHPVQQMWVGDGTFMLCGWANNKKSRSIACGARMERGFSTEQWKFDLTTEEYEHFFRESPKMIRELANLARKYSPEKLTAYCQFSHLETPTYVKGNVALVGDAAHSTTPWQGSGGGMSIEDAAILSTLLAEAKTKSEVSAALRAYDQTRRPRCQAIIDSSFDVGMLTTGRKTGVGIDSERLKEGFANKWEHIHGFDVRKAQEIALEVMDLQLQK